MYLQKEITLLYNPNNSWTRGSHNSTVIEPPRNLMIPQYVVRQFYFFLAETHHVCSLVFNNLLTYLILHTKHQIWRLLVTKCPSDEVAKVCKFTLNSLLKYYVFPQNSMRIHHTYSERVVIHCDYQKNAAVIYFFKKRSSLFKACRHMYCIKSLLRYDSFTQRINVYATK